MLPFRPVFPKFPNGRPVTSGNRRRIGTLALTSLGLAVLAAAVGGAAGGVLVALAIAALGAAGILGLRAQWAAAAPDAPATSATVPPAAPLETVSSDHLTERLRQLHDQHVEAVNMAVDEGREDLVQELSDSYMTQALALITGEGRAPHVG